MFASPADAASVLVLDLGILLGLFAMSRLLVPERAADRAVFGAFTQAATHHWDDDKEQHLPQGHATGHPNRRTRCQCQD